MRAAFFGIVLAMLVPLAGAKAENEFKTAGDFIDAYNHHSDNLLLRLYIRGVGDGLSWYNSMSESDGTHQAYCPPDKVGIVDAQYVAIMSDFLKKVPKAKDQPVALVLLFALQGAFPCHQ